MELHKYAETILFGNDLTSKLVLAENFTDQEVGIVIDTPNFPSRPIQLSRFGQSKIPSFAALEHQDARAELMHFFANHELLALELMALLILKFPHAPKGFRLGIAHTMREEQEHLQLYIKRLQAFGLEFGDLPLNTYFWDRIKGMRTPLDYVLMMSMTFEQANLDYSSYFSKIMAGFDDFESSKLLEKIYHDEIGHVKHGVQWFNNWRAEDPKLASESDWQAYKRLLPSPITAVRAKGLGFDRLGRQAAGLSSQYINELEVCAAQRGGKSNLWINNIACELELSDSEKTSAPMAVRRDLESLMIYLVKAGDILCCTKRPSIDFLLLNKSVGVELPDFVEESQLPEIFENSNIDQISPWGWTPKIINQFQKCFPKLNTEQKQFYSTENIQRLSDNLKQLYSKSWVNQLAQDLAKNNPQIWDCRFGDASAYNQKITSIDQIKNCLNNFSKYSQNILVKPNIETAGRGITSFTLAQEEELINLVKAILEKSPNLNLEPHFDRIVDLSYHFNITKDAIKAVGVRRNQVDKNFVYRGTYIGHKALCPNRQIQQFLYKKDIQGRSLLQSWAEFLKQIAIHVRNMGYLGPLCFDAFIWRDKNQNLFLRPLCEINPRWSMGRVAIGLESILDKKSQAFWQLVPVHAAKKNGFKNFIDYAESLKQKNPLVLNSESKIVSGVFFTSDPRETKRTGSYLEVLKK